MNAEQKAPRRVNGELVRRASEVQKQRPRAEETIVLVVDPRFDWAAIDRNYTRRGL